MSLVKQNAEAAARLSLCHEQQQWSVQCHEQQQGRSWTTGLQPVANSPAAEALSFLPTSRSLLVLAQQPRRPRRPAHGQLSVNPIGYRCARSLARSTARLPQHRHCPKPPPASADPSGLRWSILHAPCALCVGPLALASLHRQAVDSPPRAPPPRWLRLARCKPARTRGDCLLFPFFALMHCITQIPN